LAGAATLATFRALIGAGDAALRSSILVKSFVFNSLLRKAAIVLAFGMVAGVFAGMGSAFAEDDFPIVGNYTQNVACKGDGSDPVAVKVKITPQEIVSNVGVCTILNIKHEGETITTHVECKFPAGPLMGDITFTPRPDHNIDFVDREGNYKAILHPCPK
jgi:hypothetical protein